MCLIRFEDKIGVISGTTDAIFEHNYKLAGHIYVWEFVSVVVCGPSDRVSEVLQTTDIATAGDSDWGFDAWCGSSH